MHALLVVVIVVGAAVATVLAVAVIVVVCREGLLAATTAPVADATGLKPPKFDAAWIPVAAPQITGSDIAHVHMSTPSTLMR